MGFRIATWSPVAISVVLGCTSSDDGSRAGREAVVGGAEAAATREADTQDAYDHPPDYEVLEVVDVSDPPVCRQRACGRQRFSITITTTETDSARMEWAMRDAVVYDTPDRADAVLVYLLDWWGSGEGGSVRAYAEYSADGCGWAGSMDDEDHCGEPSWEVLHWESQRYVVAATPTTLALTWTFPGPLRDLGSWLAFDVDSFQPQGHEWIDRFGDLARPGADLSRVVEEWTYWLLSGRDSPLARWHAEPYLAQVAALFARRLDGDHPTTLEWERAEALAYSVWMASQPDDGAGMAAIVAADACRIALGQDPVSKPASNVELAAAKAAAQRDGNWNYERSEEVYEATRNLMANKLAELIAAK